MLQPLIEYNKSYILFPDWSNANDYVHANESFVSDELYTEELHNELEKVQKTNVHLASNMKFLCNLMVKKITSAIK